MERTWWKEAVVYQIYPRSFADSNGDGIGDLNGITARLDYLVKLGIDVIWLSPVYQSPNDDNGYDISDYRNIMADFGTMEDFDRMLAAAHERGIRIVMDLVANHSSDEHAWFIESRSSKDNPYRDYYIWKDPKDGGAPNNWESCFSGSAWEFDEVTGQYYLHCFSKKQPDLNWENPKMRADIYEMMDWWCGIKGIDGFRMDVISMISKDQSFPDGPLKADGYGDLGPAVCNGPRVHEYIREMNRRVLSKYDIMTVGEAGGVTIDEAKRYASADGSELNMVFQFEHVDLHGEPVIGKWSTGAVPLRDLREVLNRWQIELQGIAWNSLYWDNHDQPRAVSRFGNDSPKYRVVSAKMLATCLHMMQGTPYIYQGEELGMTNTRFVSIDECRDLEEINAWNQYVIEQQLVTPERMMECINTIGRDNARTPMQWDASANAGFTSGEPWIKVNPNYAEINAEAALADPDSVFYYYQKLIRLRHQHPVIVYGEFIPLLEDSDEIYAYCRELDDQVLTVVCNWTDHAVPCDFIDDVDGEELISNYKTHLAGMLRPYEARVIMTECGVEEE